MPVVQKYYGVYPTVLFLCSDDKHSMHFILSLKNISKIQQDCLVELMTHCAANVSFNVEDATDHSAIIVDHNEIVNFRAPAFTITYIQDCLKNLKLQDISDYRQDVTSHIAKEYPCMNVVYFKTQGWNSVLTKEEKLWFEKQSTLGGSNDIFEPLATSSSFDVLALINSRVGSPPIAQIYSDDDDSDLEEIDKQTSSRNKTCTTGRHGDASEHCHVEQQTVSSLKIAKDLKDLSNKAKAAQSSRGKTSETFTMFSERKENDRNGNRRNHISSKAASSKKWAFLDEFESGSDEEQQSKPINNKKNKNNGFFDFQAADEQLFKPNKDKKHSRMPYSYEEQSNILKYIVEHNEYSRIKGREVWIIMERRKVCPTRTWQSMKEHFLKKIAVTLEAFDFLTESDKKKIKSVVF